MLTVFEVLGGLALFMFGMAQMTRGLQGSVESQLRRLITQATSNRVQGLALGTGLGFLVHSSAATVMYVGFANAGLVGLVQAVPPIMGANLGTTLSMQMVSLKLTDYCMVAVAIGFLLYAVSSNQRFSHIGLAIFGFGLLFLGMETMSSAIGEHRAALAPHLARIDGTTVSGMLIGVALSALITGIIQSSGATIGMCFALIESGVFTSLPQVYPIVLGAHIGTCMTGLLGSIGTNIVARRVAGTHLMFNLLNVTMAIVAAPFFLWLMPKLSGDLLRQTANLHTAVMLTACILFLPFVNQLSRLTEFFWRTSDPLPESSHLDQALLKRPETALSAVIHELQRVSRTCHDSLKLNRELFLQPNPRVEKKIRLNEQVINAIKRSVREFLMAMTERYLSRRQALLIEYLEDIVIHIERIGDHLDAFCDISARRHKHKAGRFDQESIIGLYDVMDILDSMLNELASSFKPGEGSQKESVARIQSLRMDLIRELTQLEAQHTQKVADHNMPALRAVFFNECISTCKRLAQHIDAIAQLESGADFWIKQKKLDREVPVSDQVDTLPPMTEEEVEKLRKQARKNGHQ